MIPEIYVSDREGNQIGHHLVGRGLGLSWGSLWPKGHAICTFQVNRDIAEYWAVKSAYRLKIKDGHKTLYEGQIENLEGSLGGLQQSVRVEARGFYSLLATRMLRKRWVDNAPLERLVWPSGRLTNDDQNELISDLRNDTLLFHLPNNFTGDSGQELHWQYSTVSGDSILGMDYNLSIKSDDGLTLRVTNTDNGNASEWSDNSGSPSRADFTRTFGTNADISQGVTERFKFEWELTATDADYECYGICYNLVIYVDYVSSHPNAGSPNYYANEIIQDVLLKVALGEISVDNNEMVNTGLALKPFATKGDDFEDADAVIQRAAKYGTAEGETLGFSIWDGDGTSDGLPKPELKTRPTLDNWEYELSLDDMSSFRDEESLDQLYNYIAVQFTGNKGNTEYLSPDDDATLKDTASIARYGRRDKFLVIDKADSTQATTLATRFLSLHKDPLRKANLATRKGFLRTRQGTEVPASWVRAGDRVKVIDYLGGTVYLLRKVDYNADTNELRMEPDLPVDNISVFAAQQTLGLEYITPRPPRI